MIGPLTFSVHEPGVLDGTNNYYLFISVEDIIDTNSGAADSGTISFRETPDNDWVDIPANLSTNITAIVILGTTLPATGQVKVT